MATADISESRPGSPADEKGHPPGLYVLFGAEMWERFSYYGMRALLVLYLTKHLGQARASALELYATYTGLVYFTPLLGGYLADKFLGQRKAILIGGIVMALGHFAMAFESQLYLALSLLILGNGFFKPNITTMVGHLYTKGDARRDAAYTIFYMGINLGAFFSPLVCGRLNESFGWHSGFGAAGVGMVFGLISFLSFQRLLAGGYPPGREEQGGTGLTVADWGHVILISLGCAAFAYGFGRAWPGNGGNWPGIQGFVKILVPVILVGYAIGLVLVGFKASEEAGTEAGQDWQRVLVILLVALSSVVFWMAFEQAGGTLNLFAEENTDRVVFGRPIAASYFQSINPFFIFTLAPLFSVLWSRMDSSRYKLTSTAKMGIGLILLGIGCVVMYRASSIAATGVKVGPFWLVFTYFFFTVGEICLSPIGLSLVNKLAPAKAASLLMAVWFLCTAVANYLAGILEAFLEARHINLWAFLIATSIGTGVLLLAFTGPLKRMSHGRL
ncbi:peptide MFS transporter [Tundrisphaera sp. TA3]|uniref:peptide MFS transporter n=1 Tax=Tundrisphaera sp. TA3 TaxID=3435775 RepID=UPI003EB8E821